MTVIAMTIVRLRPESNGSSNLGIGALERVSAMQVSANTARLMPAGSGRLGQELRHDG
jgi:hypothetical protein